MLPEHDYGKLQEVIEKTICDRGLQPEDCSIKKVIQLYETMIVRHGVMLVGPTGGGKTSCYEVCNCPPTTKGSMGQLDVFEI